MSIYARAAAGLLGCALLCSAMSGAAEERRYTDAHLHYVDFFQHTQGIEALIEAMDEARVSNAVIMGLPVKKMWAATEPRRPKFVFSDDTRVYGYALTDEIVARAVRSLPDDQQRRLHPFISGIHPTDLLTVDHIQRMLDWYPQFWQGIGEIITRHDILTAMTLGEPARANHDALREVYRLAARNDLPVLLHSNITSIRDREPRYLPELEEVLSRHPETRFIWAHAGTSDSINQRMDLTFLDDEISRLLSQYENLWIDLSWSVFEEYVVTDDGENVHKRWLRIIERYPDRFLIGSDLVGSFGSLDKKMSEFDVLLDELSDESARKIARENLFAVLPAWTRERDSNGSPTHTDE